MSVFKDKHNNIGREIAFRSKDNDKAHVKILESFME